MTPSIKIQWTPDGEFLYACSNNNIWVLDLERDHVLDIICKPNYKVLDLKVTPDAIYVADMKNKSVVVSSIETSILNFDPEVKITP